MKCTNCDDDIQTAAWRYTPEVDDSEAYSRPLVFCSDECQCDWTFDRSVEALKEEFDQKGGDDNE